MKPFAAVAYETGMRRGEMLRLEPADVDLERGVRRSKNGEARVVPIIEGPMTQWLQWSMQNRKPGQKKLFVWEDGRPFTERNFYARWHAATKRAGVEGYVPHDSRRSANRNMRNENVQQAMRMKIMGHKTPSMDRRYGIVDFTDVVAAGKIMSAAAEKTTASTLALTS